MFGAPQQAVSIAGNDTCDVLIRKGNNIVRDNHGSRRSRPTPTAIPARSASSDDDLCCPFDY